MIDEINSLYSTAVKNQQLQQCLHIEQDAEPQSTTIATKSFRVQPNHTPMPQTAATTVTKTKKIHSFSSNRFYEDQASNESYDDKMKCDENVYSMRVPASIESNYACFGSSGSGGNNRKSRSGTTAFEVISHADIRPTTPIRYEQVDEMFTACKAAQPQQNVHSYAPQLDMSHNHVCNNLETSFVTTTMSPRYDQQQTKAQQSSQHRSVHVRTPRSHTQPIKCTTHLNYVNSGPEVRSDEVKWEVARELKTVNWDRLKEMVRDQETTTAHMCTHEDDNSCFVGLNGPGAAHSHGYPGYVVRTPSGRSKSSPVCYFENRISDYHHVNFEDGIGCDRGLALPPMRQVSCMRNRDDQSKRPKKILHF